MGRRNQHRYNIREAAEALGVSSEAVRMRVKRGTLASEKGEDGRTYVRLDADPPPDEQQTEHDDPALVEQLRSEVAYLRDQLAEANTRDRENRRLLAAALERVPELESPERSEDRPQEPEQTSTGGSPPQEQQGDTQRRGRWLLRRFFFGRGFDR